MKKFIKINDDYKITWKLTFDKSINKWFIEIFDDWKWTEKSIDYEDFDDLKQAENELKYRIKRNKNYKLWFSIMNYFYKKWNDLKQSREKVYNINNDFSDIDKMMIDRIEYIKRNNIKIVNSL